MSVNMIHCYLQCSWVKDEQRPCIIQGDTVLRHIGPGNWSQSCLQGRAGQLPWEIEAEAHRGIAINTSHDLFPTVSLQSSSLCDRVKVWIFLHSPSSSPQRPVTTQREQHWKYDQHNIAHTRCHTILPDATLQYLLSLLPMWWEKIYSINTDWQLILSWPNLMFI